MGKKIALHYEEKCNINLSIKERFTCKYSNMIDLLFDSIFIFATVICR